MEELLRSKVEHVFHRLKIDFGYAKCRYRGIAKNANRILTLLSVGNLMSLECYLKRHRGIVTGFLAGGACIY